MFLFCFSRRWCFVELKEEGDEANKKERERDTEITKTKGKLKKEKEEEERMKETREKYKRTGKSDFAYKVPKGLLKYR